MNVHKEKNGEKKSREFVGYRNVSNLVGKYQQKFVAKLEGAEVLYEYETHDH
jgi:hypothetical protein